MGRGFLVGFFAGIEDYRRNKKAPSPLAGEGWGEGEMVSKCVNTDREDMGQATGNYEPRGFGLPLEDATAVAPDPASNGKPRCCRRST